MSIIAFVCAAVSVLFAPILFGPAGIILGRMAHSRGDRLGRPAAITSGVCMVVGFILGAIFFIATGYSALARSALGLSAPGPW